MPRFRSSWPIVWLLLATAPLCAAACDDDDPRDATDTALTDDTGDVLEPPADTGDTSLDTGDTRDTSAHDTRTTGNLDIPFDVDYDARDTSVANDTDDARDTHDTAPDDTATDTTADGDDDTPDWSGPPTAFDDLAELRNDELRAALLERIGMHTSLGYDGARAAMYDPMDGIDVHDGLLECVYTGTTVVSDGSNTPGGTHNTEHSWPQSAGAGNEPARSDLHHLFPTTQISNSTRGSTPYGDTACDQSSACTWYEGGSELGPSSVNGTTVFEVRAQHRGDIARAQFYFAVRYEYTIGAATESALRQWHQQDPPDDVERTRNDAIEALQANRNPFVDRPDFVGYIADF